MISDIWTKLFKNSWQSWLNAWLKKRMPAKKIHTLQHNNIFIVPSKTGCYFCLLVFFLWLLGTNYENNLILGLAFLLLSLVVVSIHHTYAQLSGLSISVINSHAGFMGATGVLDLLIKRGNDRQYEALTLQASDDEKVNFSLLKNDSDKVSLRIPLKHRGWYTPERLKISTHFPLGLVVAWSYLYIDSSILCYPKPTRSSVLPTQQLLDENNAITSEQVINGSDDFAGIREYVAGDSLRDIDWRAMARGQGLATRTYEHHVSEHRWLDWQQFDGLTREARLSRLCFCLMQQTDKPDNHSLYGLRLPNQVLAPGSGEEHKIRLLEALALFEWEQ